MTTGFEYVVVGLLAVIGLLVLADAVIRILASRDARRDRRLRPDAEVAIGEYLAGSEAEPRDATAAERHVLLKVALDALGDLTGSERARLAGLLERIGYVSRAAHDMKARRRTVRRHAAEVLSVIDTPGTVPALEAGLADSDSMVRCICARALAEIGSDDIQADVSAVAARDVASAPGPVAAVVLALGMHRPEAIAPLLGKDTDPRVRAIAVNVVGELRLAQLAPSLHDCLDERAELAERAAQGLGRIGDVTAVDALLRLASDELRAASVRAAALVALGSIGDTSAVPTLAELLRSDDWSVRNAAALALPELGQDGLVALRHAAASPLAQVREQVEAVLQS